MTIERSLVIRMAVYYIAGVLDHYNNFISLSFGATLIASKANSDTCKSFSFTIV